MRPALCGPTRRSPPASIQAIEPPPAPIVRMSTIGAFAGMPNSISKSSLRVNSPASIRLTSQEVPPMSSVMIRSEPASAREVPAAEDAADRARDEVVHRAIRRGVAGDDAAVGLHQQQRARASRPPRARPAGSRRSRRTAASGTRRRSSCDRGRSRASADRPRATARRELRQRARSRSAISQLVRRVEVREQERDRDGADALAAQVLDQPRRRRRRRRDVSSRPRLSIRQSTSRQS